MEQNTIKTAVGFLSNNEPFLIDSLRLNINNRGVIEITGWSSLTDFKDVAKREALKELNEIKSLFFKMVNSSEELKRFIDGKSLKFNLWFDDYGKASIEICSEEDGVIYWKINPEKGI